MATPSRSSSDEDRLLAFARFDEQARAAAGSRGEESALLAIAGCDEVGRGALAGPAVVACVQFKVAPLLVRTRGTSRLHPLLADLVGIDDSKRLSPRERDRLRERIAPLVDWGIGASSAREIDRWGIVPALSLAARRAVASLDRPIGLLLLDRGLSLAKDPADPPERSFTKGDQASLHIAAASILAKTTRDRMMASLDGRFPGYALEKNKGYGTRAHQDALAALGPSRIHRATFRVA